MQQNITLLQGDCRTVLQTLPEKSIQCVVTSPPYFALRDYGMEAQIGQEETPAAYVASLVAVFREVWRVLRNDGVLLLNLGDSFSRGNKTHYVGDATRNGKNSKNNAVKNNVYANTPVDFELGQKQLLGMPWRVAFALQDDTWILRNDIIWEKPSAMPESVKDRCTRSHEYIFHFVKQPNYYWNGDAIKERAINGDPQPPRGSKGNAHVNGGLRKQNNEYATPVEYRNKRTVWRINPTPVKEAHFATFPEELAETCILAASRAGDTVLDPFAGSGTTLRVAHRLQRTAIGIELNPAYIELQEKRTNNLQVAMTDLFS